MHVIDDADAAACSSVLVRLSQLTVASISRTEMTVGQQVKWVNISQWVTWITGHRV